MQGRIFFRTLLDKLIFNTPVFRTINSLVNFCNEYWGFYKKDLKFSKNMPLYKNREVKSYRTRFIFDSSQINGASLK